MTCPGPARTSTADSKDRRNQPGDTHPKLLQAMRIAAVFGSDLPGLGKVIEQHRLDLVGKGTVDGQQGNLEVQTERTVVQVGTADRTHLVIDQHHYEGPSTGRVIAPPPLGRMGARIQELATLPVARRSIDLYAALAEVVR